MRSWLKYSDLNNPSSSIWCPDGSDISKSDSPSVGVALWLTVSTAIWGQKKRKKLEFLIFRGVKNGSKSNPLGTQGMAIFLGVALVLSWGLVVTIQSAALS